MKDMKGMELVKSLVLRQAVWNKCILFFYITQLVN